MRKFLMGVWLAMALAAVPAIAQTAPPQATLAWTYADADLVTWAVTGFTVERKTDLCIGIIPFTQIATAAKTARGYVDTPLVVGNTYCYRVAAVNATDKVYSNTASKAIPSSPPPAPGNLLITEVKVILNPDTGKWELQVKQYTQDPVTGALTEAKAPDAPSNLRMVLK